MVDEEILSDFKLVTLLRTGDHQAFTDLYERYEVIVYSYTYRKVRDRDLAQDLIQSLFTDIWQKRGVLKFEGDFLAYLFSALKRRILNHHRSSQVSQRYLDEFRAYVEERNSSTDHRIRHNDLAALIEKEVLALPPNMRRVFELSRNTHLTRKEIAETLNLSEEGVKTNMHRALKILKLRLGGLLMLM